MNHTTGGGCPICGRSYTEFPMSHGYGICNRPYGETHYIGITPEQVRQIVREELERATDRDGGSHG